MREKFLSRLPFGRGFLIHGSIAVIFRNLSLVTPRKELRHKRYIVQEYTLLR